MHAFHSHELPLCLRRALKVARCPLADCELQVLPDKGLAHDHVRLLGSGWLARIPKQSQMGLAAEANLAYQRSCFERAAASGHTPALLKVLPASVHLPRGALLVQDIAGQPAQLPRDLAAIAVALAALHRLPLPPAQRRAPLLDAADPLVALLEEIDAQAAYLSAAKVSPSVLANVAGRLKRLRMLCAQAARPTRHLIAFDGHPGNFIVRNDASAVLVDLEKCRYSYPGLDLAHATLYTSTTWDIGSHAVLTESEVAGAYAAWASEVGPSAEAAQRWHVPLRSAMWLWSITWCAKWRVLSGAQAQASADGEDWSVDRSEAALVGHVRNRVDHYLSAPVVERVGQELDALARVWPS